MFPNSRLTSVSPKASDSMEICSPQSPKLDKASRNTLPAFLLGTSVDTSKQKRQVSFTTTPIKSRHSGENEENTNPNSYQSYSNRYSKQLSSELKSRSSMGGNPFNAESRSSHKEVERPSIPVGSLGHGFPRLSNNELDSIAQTAQTVTAKTTIPEMHVMASSPIPDKHVISRIQTPDMSSGSPMSPVERRQTVHTPLARQMFERNLKQNEVKNSTLNNLSAVSVDLDQEIKCWLSVYGFTNANFDLVFKHLVSCGSVVSRKSAQRKGANWIHLRFASSHQAERCITRFHGKILDGTNILIGVVPCVESNYILNYVQGIGQTNQSLYLENTAFDANKSGLRSLVEKPCEMTNDDMFLGPEKEEDGMVRRTLNYLLPNIF